MTPRNRILGLLLHADHAMTGREIETICGLWPWSLYPALVNLEREGLITSQWQFPTAAYPRTRVYKLKPNE